MLHERRNPLPQWKGVEGAFDESDMQQYANAILQTSEETKGWSYVSSVVKCSHTQVFQTWENMVRLNCLDYLRNTSPAVTALFMGWSQLLKKKLNLPLSAGIR